MSTNIIIIVILLVLVSLINFGYFRSIKRRNKNKRDAIIASIGEEYIELLSTSINFRSNHKKAKRSLINLSKRTELEQGSYADIIICSKAIYVFLKYLGGSDITGEVNELRYKQYIINDQAEKHELIHSKSVHHVTDIEFRNDRFKITYTDYDFAEENIELWILRISPKTIDKIKSIIKPNNV